MSTGWRRRRARGGAGCRRGFTLIEVVVAVAVAGLVALAAGSAYRALARAQHEQVERVRLQREAASAVARAVAVLHLAGWGLAPGQEALTLAEADAFCARYRDPASGADRQVAVALRTGQGGVGGGWLCEAEVPAGQPCSPAACDDPLLARRLAGFADVVEEGPARVLARAPDGSPLFRYHDDRGADLEAALADPDPARHQAALRAIRQVDVTVALDRDGDGRAEAAETASAQVWNAR